MLSAEEVATILRVSRRYVLRLAREGAFERVKVPGRKVVLFRESAIDAYLASGRQPPPAPGTAARVLDGPVLERRSGATAGAARRRKRFS
jgi:excisionase family DNA binding protein